VSEVGLRIEGRQHQALTPRLQQAVRLLQLSSLEFAQEVQQALGSNPFLEPEESEDGPTPRSSDPETGDGVPAIDVAPPGETMSLDGAAWGESWSRGSGNRSDDGGDMEAGEFTASSVSLREHLWHQFSLMPLSMRDRMLGRVLIEALDDDGYLRVGFDDLRRVAEIDPSPEDEEWEVALRLVQSLEPLGIGARDLRECLLLQLDERDPAADRKGAADGALADAAGAVGLWRNGHRDPQGTQAPGIALNGAGHHARSAMLGRDACGARSVCPADRQAGRHGFSPAAVDRLAARLVDGHLPLLAARDFTGIARRLGVDAAVVDAICERVRRLQPRPGWHVGSNDARFVTPDVIVRKVRENWIVQLNESIVPRVRLHRVYANLFQSHRNAEHGEMARQLQEARWMVRNVEQRFSTILRVASEIVAQQRSFFDYGELAMRPMALREIADKLGLHESTVSRVTNNKFMATPLGVFELKFFFSRPMATAAGGSCSATAIRSVIRELISGETPRSPLSDAEITRLLRRQGLQVARRTVTKYRQMMRVPAVEIRRQRANAAAHEVRLSA